ncbi:hypothetical protein P691DRAFT_765591 [Macrolepiota fuliginosa MF-IS2]|uniref:Uncharacterized protein n=1 Tax=Macrolepiota fuliginosa MF-IS2 TaxID=1400762 RepID=A0A9P6BVR2_9AGAR|nr:hypothetical protein P691DRAFT_765591 [Macrolepiota fuliginosa MF-IS2]
MSHTPCSSAVGNNTDQPPIRSAGNHQNNSRNSCPGVPHHPSGPTGDRVVKCYSCGGLHYANKCNKYCNTSHICAAHTEVPDNLEKVEEEQQDNDPVTTGSIETAGDDKALNYDPDMVEVEVIGSEYGTDSDDIDYPATMNHEDMGIMSDYGSDTESSDLVYNEMSGHNYTKQLHIGDDIDVLQAMTDEPEEELPKVYVRHTPIRFNKEKILRPQI